MKNSKNNSKPARTAKKWLMGVISSYFYIKIMLKYYILFYNGVLPLFIGSATLSALSPKKHNRLNKRKRVNKGGPLGPRSGRQPAATDRWLAV